MAEYVDIIDLKTSGATKNTKSLKSEIKQLKEELYKAKQGTEEYNKILQDLGEKQRILTETNKRVAEASTDFSNNVQYSAQALAGLSGAVQSVTGVLSMMGVETEKDSGLMKILVSSMAITSGITAMQNGYTAVRRLGEGLKIATAGATGLNKALALIKANPVMAVLSAITLTITAITALTKKHREEKKALEERAEAEKQLREQQSKRIQEAKINTEQEIKTLNNLIRIAKDESKSMKDRQNAIASLNSKYPKLNASIKANGKYVEGTKDAYKEYVKALKLTAEIIELEAKIEVASAKYKTDKIIEETTRMNNAIKPTKNTPFPMKETLSAVENKALAEVRASEKTLEDLNTQIALKMAERDKIMSKDSGGTNTKNTETPYQKLLKSYEKDKKLLDAQYNAQLFSEKEYYNQQINNLNDFIKKVEQLKQTPETQEALQFLALDLRKLMIDNASNEDEQAIKDAERYVNDLLRTIEQTVVDYDKEELNINKWLGLDYSAENEKIADDKIREATEKRIQKQLAIYQELLQNGDLSLEQQTQFQNAITELEVEQADIRIANAQREFELKEEAQQRYLDNYNKINNSISDIISAYSNTLDKESRQYKNLKIAEATISTINGGVNAYMSAMKLPYPTNLIVGATSLATVLANGYAQIASLRQVNPSGSNNVTPNSTAIQSLASNVTNVRQTTTDSDYIELSNKQTAQKVYVLTQDINESQNKLKTKVRDNTF